MRKIIVAALLALMFLPAAAQNKSLSEVLLLQMPTDPGARASSIAWHPTLKRYYAPKSGNASYSMGIFDAKGNLVSPDELKVNFDIRGFWYSPRLKTFCANGYSDYGWVSYVLDRDGIPTDVKHDIEYQNQPDLHSVGSYDDKNNVVFFLKGQNILAYSASKYDQLNKKIRLHIGSKNKTDAELNEVLYGEDDTPEDYNYTTAIYTGIPTAEFALLNVYTKTIEFYDMKTGYITKTSKLPSDAPAENMLCFTYANGIFFLFDLGNKMWHGYK